jgi:hypothetical protein
MALDVAAAGAQVRGMAGALAVQAARMRAVPAFGSEVLSAWHVRPDDAREVLEGVESGGTWPFAVPVEPLLSAVAVHPEPSNYTVLATDGSQIDADSHGMVRCILINTGWAVIGYGVKPYAWLASSPTVRFEDDDLFVEGEDGLREEVGDQFLPLLRTVAEMERLAELAEERRGHGELVAVADGTLVHWEFAGKRGGAGRAALFARYLAALATFRALEVPVCSYSSRPNHRDVANAVALLAGHACHSVSDACDTCGGRKPPLCESLRTLNDTRLMQHLRPGQRSALFRNVTPILQQYDPADRVLFCYLKLEEETARIEVPNWVGADPDRLSRVLAVIYGQCRRGRGYPVVLQEAHEQAVIHGSAREAFRCLVEAALVGEGLAAAVSLKRLSKDLRAV